MPFYPLLCVYSTCSSNPWTLFALVPFATSRRYLDSPWRRRGREAEVGQAERRGGEGVLR